MTQVIVPVRYPLSEHSRATVEEGARIADERDGALIVLHVNLYQNGDRTSRRELKRAVESIIGSRNRTRYVVRSGFLVEETILDEVAAERADIVVIGRKQVSRWRRMVRKLTDDPDVERFLREKVDAEIVTVG
ncbi:universal stress protein [Halomarina oriensis]|uniref:Universal stress protein n=1 Tax=Halomarina oriensis TaxID=671145 RepID=A0A6B0GN04_9EURY|nr:universal stress protein [Halomarina oriensis]MWG36050.1 universal stress protein [Halomarina oriensis]